MPEPNVREDLAVGRLVRLELPEAKSGRYIFQAMYRTDTPPGPAAAWLIQRFVDQFAATSERRRPTSRPRKNYQAKRS
jgi:DNA-binding transcriptional LysR family regulator